VTVAPGGAAASGPEAPSAPQLVDRETPSAFLAGGAARAAFAIGIVFSLFQLWTAAFSPLSSIVQRSIHVGFLLLMVFVLFGVRGVGGGKAGPNLRQRVPWYDWLLGGAGFALGFYHFIFESALIQRAGDPTTADIVAGILVVALVFEASRRVVGLGLPLFCILFVPYALFGRYLPFGLSHRGFRFEQVVDQLYLSTEGIYGTPTYVSATFIFLFVLFGAFLERAGMIRLFNDVSLGLVGHAKGGPAKVAVVASGLMGTINGSGVANVLTTGQFTIPLMTRFGYRPAFAGAVEATASMGGQILPPVMGAVAFIMAETLALPYATIATAAILPALLYYGSAFWMVHLEAGKRNLVGLPKDQCPSALAALRQGWYLLLPLAALIWLLFGGYTPLFAGVIGLAGTAVIILGRPIAGLLPVFAWRLLFWVLLGLSLAAIGASGYPPERIAAFAIVALCAACFAFRGGRATLRLVLDALAEGAKNAVGVGIACALVGILIGVASLTGAAANLAGGIVALSGGNLFLALLLTMVACLVLGTGLPTIPNYIITSSIAAPALLALGVPLLSSHMFVFYFGIMADLTPPVALAALAASSIARAGHMEIGWIATRIAFAGYVVPFLAVYDGALLLQTDDPFAVVYVVVKAILAVMLWGAIAIGWFRRKLALLEFPVAAAGAIGLVLSTPLSDEIGFALTALFLAMHLWRTRAAAG
jgi:TRAP transporter 4TM/12TM fusion protein